jgi:hypothetical protein
MARYQVTIEGVDYEGHGLQSDDMKLLETWTWDQIGTRPVVETTENRKLPKSVESKLCELLNEEFGKTNWCESISLVDISYSVYAVL